MLQNLASTQGYGSQLYIHVKREKQGYISLDLICYPSVYMCNVRFFAYMQLGYLRIPQGLVEKYTYTILITIKCNLSVSLEGVRACLLEQIV